MRKQNNNAQNNAKQRGDTKMPGGITGKGFRPGQSGNPKGRPSTRGLAARLKVELGQVGKGNVLAEELLVKRYPLKRGEEMGSAHRIDWANGSWFKGVPQGERQLASDHPYGYFNDETAHQAGVEDTISIAKPAVRQIICVSSVAPGFFWSQVSQTA